MFKLREILRLHFENKMSNQKIADSLQIAKSSVFKQLHDFKSSGLDWPLSPDLDDCKLAEILKPELKPCRQDIPIPDWAKVAEELSKRHVTLFLLWEEYRQDHPLGLGRSSFYERFRAYRKSQTHDYRIDHRGGEKLYIDYSGDGARIYDRETGKFRKVELFVCTWGASNYSYVEFTESQTLGDWIDSHVRAFRYFGCVPQVLVPDNLKSGVREANYYDPDLNPTYSSLAAHYSTAVLPTRSRKPKDKALVENHVLHVQRFLLGRIRNLKFYTLDELNETARNILEDFNAKFFQKKEGTRKAMFEKLDRQNALNLPLSDFKVHEMKRDQSVGSNYHILFGKHYYSVPFSCREKNKGRVDIYLSGNLIEIYQQQNRIASHLKGPGDYTYSTNPEHMPANHRFIREMTPEKMIQKAEGLGPNVKRIAEKLINENRHPEVGLRMVLGIVRLENRYSAERIESAALRALYYNRFSFRDVVGILEQNLDQIPTTDMEHIPVIQRENIKHENIRGPEFYKQFENQ